MHKDIGPVAYLLAVSRSVIVRATHMTVISTISTGLNLGTSPSTCVAPAIVTFGLAVVVSVIVERGLIVVSVVAHCGSVGLSL